MYKGDSRACLVIGLGNPLMRDEGVGGEVLRALKSHYGAEEHVEFLDGGTGGVALVHAMKGHEKVVFIDCAHMSEEPGMIRRFHLEDVQTAKDLPQMSLHEADLMQIIHLAERVGQCPTEVTIFGIEPQSVEPGHELSGVLSANIDAYVREIAADLGIYTSNRKRSN